MSTGTARLATTVLATITWLSVVVVGTRRGWDAVGPGHRDVWLVALGAHLLSETFLRPGFRLPPRRDWRAPADGSASP